MKQFGKDRANTGDAQEQESEGRAPLRFRKMHGSGNDFILIDNRSAQIPSGDGPHLARRLCRRKFNVGADGLILIESSEQAHFRWRFYNADGSEAEMCGNGGRCAARFAFMEGIAPRRLVFETAAGLIHADVNDRTVRLQLPTPTDLQPDVPLDILGKRFFVHFLNTGVPHAVLLPPDLETAPIYELGRAIRRHSFFEPAGTNADFVQILDSHHVALRTYERGVEDETLACGTGAVASAILTAYKGLTKSPVHVQTRGGEILTAYFELKGEEVREVFLEGEAILVYSACLDGDV